MNNNGSWDAVKNLDLGGNFQHPVRIARINYHILHYNIENQVEKLKNKLNLIAETH